MRDFDQHYREALKAYFFHCDRQGVKPIPPARNFSLIDERDFLRLGNSAGVIAWWHIYKRELVVGSEFLDVYKKGG